MSLVDLTIRIHRGLNFTMTPFMISTEDGVNRIVKALDKKKKMFIFPFIWKLVIALEGPISFLMSKPFRNNHKKNRNRL